MTEEELKKLQKEGKVEEVKEEVKKEPEKEKIAEPIIKETLEDFIIVLEELRQIKRYQTTAPTNIPRNFLEQIEFVKTTDTPPDFRVYFYIANEWKYITLS